MQTLVTVSQVCAHVEVPKKFLAHWYTVPLG